MSNDNVYVPMDVSRLRRIIQNHAPLYAPGKSSGFDVEEVDEEQAVVTWKNNGTDETTHRDETEKLADWLKKDEYGYEVKMLQPANTTLAVRRVAPYVLHGSAFESMGPFELAVEKRFGKNLQS